MLRRRFLLQKPPDRWDYTWTPDMGNLEQYGFVKQVSGSDVSTQLTEDFFQLNGEGNFASYIGYLFPVQKMEYGAFEIDVCVLGKLPPVNGFRAMLSNGNDGTQAVIRDPSGSEKGFLCYEPRLNSNTISVFPLDGNYHKIKAEMTPEHSNFWLDGVHVGVNLPHSKQYTTKSWFLSQGIDGAVRIRSIKLRVGE